jgi:hypothetical protein
MTKPSRTLREFPPKYCKECNQPFIPSGANQKICRLCKTKDDLISEAAEAQEEALKDIAERPEVLADEFELTRDDLKAPVDVTDRPTIKDCSIGRLSQGVLAYTGCQEVSMRFEDVQIIIRRI